MIGVSVRSNLDQVTAHFRELQDGVVDKATVRALNRALDQSATAANREIRKVYNVKASAVSSAMKKQRAARLRSGVREAVLKIRGGRIGLVEFDARQTKEGVTVLIKKGEGRKLIRHAFLTTVNVQRSSWRPTSFSYRGVYIRVGRERYPIKALKSITIPQAFAAEVVLEAVRAVARESFTRNYLQQIKFLGGAGGADG